MEMKYNEYIKWIRDCPPTECTEEQLPIVAYRFGMSEQVSESEFLPNALEQPKRTFKSRGECCSSYALSFFATEENLRNRFEALSNRSPGFKKKFRNGHVVETQINRGDGKMTEPNKCGHFDLHESQNTALPRQSSVIGEL